MTPTDRLLAALREHDRNPRRSGAGWTALCPAHNDHHSSLSISEGDDGRVLVRCHAGCEASEVASAIGLKMSDLMPPRQDTPANRSSCKKPRLSVPALRETVRNSESSPGVPVPTTLSYDADNEGIGDGDSGDGITGNKSSKNVPTFSTANEAVKYMERGHGGRSDL